MLLRALNFCSADQLKAQAGSFNPDVLKYSSGRISEMQLQRYGFVCWSSPWAARDMCEAEQPSGRLAFREGDVGELRHRPGRGKVDNLGRKA